MDCVWEIKDHYIEYLDEEHVYVVDGIFLPSITQIVKLNNPTKYARVSADVLKKAAELGTAVHEAVEAYAMKGTPSDLPEVRGFKFLQKHFKFTVEAVELPVLLFRDDKPIAAGRFDLLIRNEKGELGIADIKRTSNFDKDYLAYQLTLYRRAFMQSYDQEITFLAGLHLREDVRKYAPIPICDDLVDELLDKYFAGEEDDNE